MKSSPHTRIFFSLMMLITLSGCLQDLLIPRHHVSVRSFTAPETYGQVSPGKTFIISSLKPGFVGGLEFRSYAAVLSNILTNQGYVPQTDPNASADLMFLLDYERLPVITRQNPTAEPATMVSSASGRPMWVSHVDVVTVHPLQVHLQILKGTQSANDPALYEGTAKIESRQDDLAQAMPILLRALIEKGFFGTGGQWQNMVVMDERPR